MSTQAQTEIHVPALMDGDRIVIPQAWLARGIDYKTDRRGNVLTAADYQDFKPATLAELRHAYFDKTGDVFVSPDYRQSVLSNRGRGEWTSTFLQDGTRAIETPENVVYRNGLWIAEGGKVTPVELPPNGWTLEYDKPTGFPSRTSQKRKDAEKIFGDDASYFYHADSGLRAVLRDFFLDDDGPFRVHAYCGPDYGCSSVGVRPCRRE